MSPALAPLPTFTPPAPTVPGRPRTWKVLPFPISDFTGTGISDPPSTPLPAWPDATEDVENFAFPKSWPSPLAILPFPGETPTSETAAVALSPSPLQAVPPVAPVVARHHKSPAEEPADFKDDDLREAFGPIVEDVVRTSVDAKKNGIDTYLEPMLRATIRRALAEYAPATRPFQPPGTFDRFIWHVQALFTSRTYEDIFFEKTRRFQVEEVFVLDSASLALISFASCDPARHASIRRVSTTANRIALDLRDERGAIRKSFELADRRSVIARQGSHVVLMAVVRGIPGELACADLEFALRRIEDQFRDEFEVEGSSLLFALQPFLEDCLLIQAPASAA